MRFLEDIAKLTPEEFLIFWNSGVFTGFTEQEIAEASETDAFKMRATNECLRLGSEARRLLRLRREQLQRRGQ